MASPPAAVVPPPRAAPRAAEPSSERRFGPGAERAVVVVATAVSAALALRGVRRSVWLDEAISSVATTQLLETWDRTAGTMGVYYLALTGWSRATGGSLVAMRLLSVLLLVVTVPMAHRVARRLLPRPEALVATVLVAVSPAMVSFGNEARSYALAIAVAVASWSCLARALDVDDDDRTAASRWWAAVAVLSVVGTSAHGLYVLQIAAQGASLAAAGLWSPLRRLRPAVLGAAALLVLQLSAGADSIASWIAPLHLGQVRDAGAVLLGPTWLVAACSGILVVVGIATRVTSLPVDPRARWAQLAPVAWGVVPLLLLLVLSLARPYFIPRYLSPSLPALGMLAAVGAGRLDRALARRWPRVGPVGVVAAVAVLASLAGHLDPATAQGTDDDWRAAARTLAADARPGDAVVFPIAELKLAFDVEWAGLAEPADPAPTVLYPDQELGSPRRFVEPLTGSDLRAAAEGRGRIWVVARTMQGGGDVALDGTIQVLTEEGLHVVAHHRHRGGVQVVLLERTPA